MLIDAPMLPTLPAVRLSLRWLTGSDVDALYTVFSDPEVMRYWSWLPWTERGQAVELLESIEEGFRNQTLFQCGIARREDDRVIGTCSLYNFDLGNRRAEIGYILGRAYWGKGYATEALTALIEYVFQTFSLHRIEADVDPRNAASIRLLERLGFQREGYLRERWLVGGETQDALFYGLLRREWESRGEAPK
jgi:RimJ/RimL family protein N-acetyltransferase